MERDPSDVARPMSGGAGDRVPAEPVHSGVLPAGAQAAGALRTDSVPADALPVDQALGGSIRTPADPEDKDGVRGGDGPAADPLAADPRVAAHLGAAYSSVARFHQMLTAEGVLRGLIGPREVPRLWERHLLNSAALVPYLPTTGRLIDVGSGAGLPGVVLAAMLPEVEVVLLEPMERRVDWLSEVVERLSLANAVVRRGRAEEAHGVLSAQAVTARAVAPMDRLARWTFPLLEVGGVLVTLKGRQAAEEIERARRVLTKLGAGPAEVYEALTLEGLEPTTVVRIERVAVRSR